MADFTYRKHHQKTMTCADHPDSELVNSFTGIADHAGLTSCMALSEAICSQLQMTEEDAYAVRLSVEEACINVVDHGYANSAPGPMQLDFRVLKKADQRKVIIQLKDRAVPFHPDQATEPDLLADVDDRHVGGLGWFFIKSTMDDVSYQTANGENCLTLVKRLSDRPVGSKFCST